MAVPPTRTDPTAATQKRAELNSKKPTLYSLLKPPIIRAYTPRRVWERNFTSFRIITLFPKSHSFSTKTVTNRLYTNATQKIIRVRVLVV